MDILKYKGYEGTAELDMDRGVCRGKVLLINDLITYESDSPRELQKQFEAAIEDYIQTCEELGRPAQTPLKGQFNVRISPDLHKKLILRAASDDVSLNEVVSRACEAYVCQHEVNHHHNHNHNVIVKIDETNTVSRVASSTAGLTWETGVSNVRH